MPFRERVQCRFSATAPSRRGRCGRSALLILTLVAAACLVALAAFSMRTAPAEPPRGGPGPEQPLLHAQLEAGTTPDGARVTIEVRDPQRLERPNDSFVGRGRLRGRVEVERGEFPATWHLVLEPSRTLRGPEYGERRVQTFTSDTRDFAFDDLPLAGYELRIEAEGLNSRVRHVLLQKPVVDQYVVIRLTPTGFVDGRVLDLRGLPVADLPVVLETIPDGIRRSATTDSAGAFVLPGVLDGNYRLHAGDADHPLTTKELLFRAPSLHVELEVPPLAHLSCRVVDGYGNALEGVTIRGYGSAGGKVGGTSDRAGLIELPFLPAGTYRLTANDQRHGRGRVRIEVEEGQRIEVELPLTGP